MSEELYSGTGDLCGVVVGVGANADGSNNRYPARYSACGRPLRNPYADSSGHSGNDLYGRLLDEVSLANSHDKIANCL